MWFRQCILVSNSALSIIANFVPLDSLIASVYFFNFARIE